MIVIISGTLFTILFTIFLTSFLIRKKNTKKLLHSNFIKIYDNTLTPEFCKMVIEKYTKDNRKHEGVVGGGLIKDIKDTTDLMLSKLDDWKDIDDIFYKSLNTHLNKYSLEINLMFKKYKCVKDGCVVLSKKSDDTGYQIQRYIKNRGKYIWHHDFMTKVNNKDKCNADGRILTFLWYLNDVEEGGETEFVGGTRVKPKAGSLCIFPATWTFRHRGCMPISNDKYIATGWVWNTYSI